MTKANCHINKINDLPLSYLILDYPLTKHGHEEILLGISTRKST